MSHPVQRGGSLTPEDHVVWQTVTMHHALTHRRLNEYPRLQATVRMPDGRGPLAVGPFKTQKMEDVQVQAKHVDPRRSGVYTHANFGNRKAIVRSIGYQAATSIGANMVNRRNERKADAASGWQWVDVDRGEINLGTTGAVLRGQGSTYHWAWPEITNAELMDRNLLRLEMGQHGRRSEVLSLRSPYAEMLFVMWAHAEFPEHAQLHNQVWVPQGWRERIRRQGFALPPGA